MHDTQIETGSGVDGRHFRYVPMYYDNKPVNLIKPEGELLDRDYTSITVDFDEKTPVYVGRSQIAAENEQGLRVDVSDAGTNSRISRKHGFFHHMVSAHRGGGNLLLYTDRSTNHSAVMRPKIDQESGTITYQTKMGMRNDADEYKTLPIYPGTVVEFAESPTIEDAKGVLVLCMRNPLKDTEWTFIRLSSMKDIPPSVLKPLIHSGEAQVQVINDTVSPIERSMKEQEELPGRWTETGFQQFTGKWTL